QRAVDVLVEVEGGEDDDLDAVEPPVGGDAAGRLQPVHAGHPDVHQRDVGEQLAAGGERLLAVGRLAGHRDVVLVVEDRGESRAHQPLVVGQQNLDHVAPFPRGRRARTRKPPPGPGPAVSSPPSARARSFIPWTPEPVVPGAGPRPSSATSMRTSRGPCSTRTVTDPAPECRTTLVSDSWTIR